MEVKSAQAGLPKDFWATVSAFANTQGGDILLGLDESREFSVLDIDVKKIQDAVISGFNTSSGANPQVEPVPGHQILLEPFEGKTVIRVQVEALTPDVSAATGPGPVYVSRQGVAKGTYKRVGDQNQRMSAAEIYNVSSRWTRPDIDREPVQQMDLSDLDEALVSSLLHHASSVGSRILDKVDSLPEKLKRFAAVDANGEVTLAGALTLGAYPQQFFPQLIVDVMVHPMREKGEGSHVRYIDRKICDGPIPLMVEDAVRRTMANLKTRRVVKGVRAEDIPEIPENVLREAITNAVMHRDYSNYLRGRQISVNVYPDRVEVTSPGGLFGNRTTDNLDDGESLTRNSALGNLLRRTPSRAGQGVIAETAGTGIPRMRATMRGSGLPAPLFEAGLDWFKVTMQRHGLLNAETFQWLEKLPDSQAITTEEQMVLALITDIHETSVMDIRQKLGYDSELARDVLAELLSRGLIQGGGDGPYVIERNVVPAPKSSPTYHLEGLEAEIYALLDTDRAKSIRELAEETSRAVSTLRPVLRGLVDSGLVVATAPPTSRNRAYLKRELSLRNAMYFPDAGSSTHPQQPCGIPSSISRR